jgi:CheY-like chemotaxis protein
LPDLLRDGRADPKDGVVSLLVVSTDSVVREKLAMALAATGEEVLAAASTAEGVLKAPGARVVVLDLLTEGVDGSAFTGRAVVVVGVHEDQPILIGADCYMKDFTLARLTEAVGAAA